MSDLIQEQTKQAFIDFSRRFGPNVILPAEVMAVNGDDTVHIKFSDDSEIQDARLKSVVKAGNKFLLIPKVGSIVQVARIEDSAEWVVIAVEEITEVNGVIDTLTVSMDSNGFLFQLGTETLKKLMDDLFAAILQERHETNTGVTIDLTPDSVTRYNNLKTRFDNFLR